MRRDIDAVLEAALIRATQWRHIANGRHVIEDDVVDELFDCEPAEAASIAEEQEAAINRVRESLPPGGGRFGLDTLALNAMCMWEHVLTSKTRLPVDGQTLHEWIADGEGAWSAREGCWKLAARVESAWRSADPTDLHDSRFDAFDWDFVPAWLDQLHTFCAEQGLKVGDVDDEIAQAVAQVIVRYG